MGVLFLTFWESSWLFSVRLHQYMSHQQGTSVPFFSPTLVVSCHFDDSHSNRYEVLSHCGFQFEFPWLVMVEHLFMYMLVCLLWKNLNSDCLPIFKSDGLIFFLLSCMSHILCLSVPSLQPSFVSNCIILIPLPNF